MEITEPAGKNGGNTADDRHTDEPSVASSLEHLVAASQGVITKRIDLALLEGRELLSRTVRSAALVGLGIVLAAAAWFALAASGVLFALPEESSVVHLAAFALLNGGCAFGLIALALRSGRPQTRVRTNGNESSKA